MIILLRSTSHMQPATQQTRGCRVYALDLYEVACTLYIRNKVVPLLHVDIINKVLEEMISALMRLKVCKILCKAVLFLCYYIFHLHEFSANIVLTNNILNYISSNQHRNVCVKYVWVFFFFSFLNKYSRIRHLELQVILWWLKNCLRERKFQ